MFLAETVRLLLPRVTLRDAGYKGSSAMPPLYSKLW